MISSFESNAFKVTLILLTLLSILLPDPVNTAYVYPFKLLNNKPGKQQMSSPMPPDWFTFGPYVTLPPGTVRASLNYEATAEDNAVDCATENSSDKGCEPRKLSPRKTVQTVSIDSPDHPVERFQIRSRFGGKGTLTVHNATIQHLQGRSKLLSLSIFLGIVLTLVAYFKTGGRRRLKMIGRQRLLPVNGLGCLMFFTLWLARFIQIALPPIYLEDGLIQLLACGAICTVISLELYPKIRLSHVIRAWGIGGIFTLLFSGPAALEVMTILKSGDTPAINDLSAFWRIGMQIPPFLLVLEAIFLRLPRRMRPFKGVLWASVILALLIPPIFGCTYFALFKQTLGKDAIFAIYQTNPSEALEFLSQFRGILSVGLLMLTVCWVGLSLVGTRKIFNSEDETNEMTSISTGHNHAEVVSLNQAIAFPQRLRCLHPTQRPLSSTFDDAKVGSLTTTKRIEEKPNEVRRDFATNGQTTIRDNCSDAEIRQAIFSANNIFTRLFSKFCPLTILFFLLFVGLVDSAFETFTAQKFAQIYSSFKGLKNGDTDIGPIELTREAAWKHSVGRTKIVVIGESANREHMSLYGYHRKTTPWMDSLRDRWIRFDRTYSSNKFTLYALENALSEKNQYSARTFPQSLTVVEALQRAGYRVTWLSNHTKGHEFSTPFDFVAHKANRSKWVEKSGENFDQALIPEVKKISSSHDNVIFIHILGSHGLYKDRFPKNRKVFSKGENPTVIDEYDDSILYTDAVLKEIFEYARDNLNMDAFIYFSDHGEDPGVPRDRFHWPMVRIPLVMWFSDDFNQEHSERIQRLKDRQQAFWGNDMLYDTLLGIFGVRTNRMNPQFDLSGENYNVQLDDLTVEDGKLKVRNDPGLTAP